MATTTIEEWAIPDLHEGPRPPGHRERVAQARGLANALYIGSVFAQELQLHALSEQLGALLLKAKRFELTIDDFTSLSANLPTPTSPAAAPAPDYSSLLLRNRATIPAHGGMPELSVEDADHGGVRLIVGNAGLYRDLDELRIFNFTLGEWRTLIALLQRFGK